MLASPALKNDPRNHCVPVLDILVDPVVPDGVILVLPLLRQIDRPAPATIKEFVPLIQQTLEVSCSFLSFLSSTESLDLVDLGISTRK